ncbi:hypothetical protein RN001_007078 [Aquatica leii]|uniref:Luciferin 4-monooxygenase n=1 Tax=Aquatica leii TaxID=1421715 RepID=A0AAN7PXS5_9COLE|nr:hypothetical protein RN001_007078 [Aquatica leii]
MSVMQEVNVLSGPIPNTVLKKQSLGQYVFDALKSNYDQPSCMTDAVTGNTHSYKYVLEITCQLANSLLRNGCKKNDIIAISSENSMHVLYPVIASFYIGLGVAPLNENYTERELKQLLSISTPKIVFCSIRTAYKFIKIKEKCEYIEKIVLLDSLELLHDTESLMSFISFKPNTNIVETFQPLECDWNDTIALIMCSSGTTGIPKNVVVTHRNVIVTIENIKDPSVGAYLCLKPGDHTITFLPMFHAFGLITILKQIVSGYHTLLISKFEITLFLSTVQKIKSIRHAYGMTEATMLLTISPVNDFKLGSSGKLVPYLMGKIIDSNTKENLKAYKTGELCFKGDVIMKGYLKNEVATIETIDKDGWLHTGDYGFYDSDGHFYIQGRLKEIIRYNGFQISPTEIEMLLLEHPQIKDAAVFGIPHKTAEEVPAAFVVLQPNSSLTENDVKKFVANELVYYKHLRGEVKFLDEIPRTLTGKFNKSNLSKLFLELSL